MRAALAAISRNRRLLRTESAYALFCVYELAMWVTVLLWAYGEGGTGFAGLVSVLQLVPAALLAPVGGFLGDRLPRDRALRVLYAGQGLAMVAVAVLLATHAPSAAVVVAAVVATVVIGWSRPSHYGACAELSASPGEASAANSLSGTLESGGNVVGPVLAGAAALLGGPATVAALSAGLAFVAAGVVGRLGLSRPVPLPGSAARNVAATLREQPAIVVVLLLMGVQFLALGAGELLAVAFTAQVLQEDTAAAGSLIASVGLGGMVGAAGAVVLSGRRRLAGAAAGALLLAGLPLLLMPSVRLLAPALLVGVVSGAALAFFAVATITVLQRAVDDSLVAGVLALRESALLTGLAAGAAVIPPVVAALGPGPAYAVLGGTLALLAVVTLPVLNRLDRRGVFRPEVVRLLRSVPFLAVLDGPALERLALRARPLDLPAGTVVVRQGAPGDAYFLVASGRLEVSVTGRPHRVVLGPGEGFGEIALLRGVPRTATVTVVDQARLWTIDSAAFLATVAGSAGAELANREVTARLDRLRE